MQDNPGEEETAAIPVTVAQRERGKGPAELPGEAGLLLVMAARRLCSSAA